MILTGGLFNLDIIDGKETTLDQIISTIETLPFMDDKKVVILKDFELSLLFMYNQSS